MKRFAPVLSVVLLLAPFAAASAKTCELAIEGNDAMQFNQKELTVEKDCTEVKLTLKHTGKLPKSAMGHNWVLTTDKDMAAVTGDAAKAGLAKDFLPADGDKRVVAATKLVGGGESASTSFKRDALKAGETYRFFCTFPGHSGVMNGTLKF